MKNSRTPFASLRPLAWLLPLVACCAVPPLQAETVDVVNKTLTAAPGGRLVVDVEFGSIRVIGAETTDVTLEIERKVSARTKEAEEDFLRDRPVTVEQEGNTVTVRARRQTGDTGSWFGGWLGGVRTSGRVEVTVPAHFDVELKTSGGAIAVRELAGSVRVHTSGGGLEFTGIEGPIDGRTSGGGIRLSGCRGKVDVHSSGGPIESRDGEGDLALHTSGGRIAVAAHRGNVEAHSSGGGIVLESVAGNVSGNTSGGSIRAALTVPPDGECRLSTSGGGVTVKLPENAAFDLDASTSGGGVSSDFPIAGAERQRGKLRGEVNGGGPLLHLRSSGGSIRIERSGAAATPVEK